MKLPNFSLPQQCYSMIGYQTHLLNHRRRHSVGASHSAVVQKSWDGPRMEIEIIKQVLQSFHFTLLEPEEHCPSDLRLMTNCRLTGNQVNRIKFNIKYGQGTLQGWGKQSGLLKYNSGCLNRKELKYWLSKLVLCCFGCSRHFDMVCMTGWKVGYKPAGIWKRPNFCKMG